MITILNEKNSLLNSFLAEIRDTEIQKDTMRFRRNMERIGEIMAYEISRLLEYKKNEITTPLGKPKVSLPSCQPVIASILRAGIPFHQGFLNYFDKAENIFIAAYRKYSNETDFEIKLDYVSGPSAENKVLVLCDPMLATGWSMVKVHDELTKYAKPKFTYMASVIAAQPGIDYILSHIKDSNFHLITAALDPGLDKHSYIVPGLGDAGDLSFGKKD